MINQKLTDDAIVDVVEAEYIAPYKVHLWFSDGFDQIVDFGPFIKKSHHPEIKKYRNYSVCFQIPPVLEKEIWQFTSK